MFVNLDNTNENRFFVFKFKTFTIFCSEMFKKVVCHCFQRFLKVCVVKNVCLKILKNDTHFVKSKLLIFLILSILLEIQQLFLIFRIYEHIFPKLYRVNSRFPYHIFTRFFLLRKFFHTNYTMQKVLKVRFGVYITSKILIKKSC